MDHQKESSSDSKTLFFLYLFLCQSRISVYNAVAVFNVSGRSIKSVRFNVFLRLDDCSVSSISVLYVVEDID